MTFFVQLYDAISGKFNGASFESATLGGQVPRAGDTIISPLTKADFEPRDPAKHVAFDVHKVCFLPDVTGQQANIIKLLVRQRPLTDVERATFR